MIDVVIWSNNDFFFPSERLHGEAGEVRYPRTDVIDADCYNSTGIMKEIFPNPNSPLLVARGDDSSNIMWAPHRRQRS